MADTTHDDDFLDGSAPHYAGYTEAPTEAPRRRVPAAMVTAAWLVVGLVVGAVAVGVWHSDRTSTAAGLPSAATAQGGHGAAGGSTGGLGGGFRGGRDGEQHVTGTLTAVGTASITVRTAGGTTTTYPIESSTQLVKDGQQVGSLSAMSVGDTVLVHVYPANGSTHVERVIDGLPPAGGFGPPAGQDGNGPGGSTGTTHV